MTVPRGPAVRPGPASVRTVAERAGVSAATVSRVMNGIAKKVSAATEQRVRQAAAELGYRPLSAGRALRQRRSRLVAVLAPNLANPTMAAIAASIETALRQEGLVMVLCDTHDQPAIQDEYLREMQAHLVRATVLLGAVASPILQAMAEAGERLIFVNRRFPGPGVQPFVGIDNLHAGQDVADFFLRRGIPVLGVIHGPLASSATADRITGFRDRLAAFGAALPDECVATEDMADHVAIGHAAIERLVAGGGPGGVFCASDLIAYGAHSRLTGPGWPKARRGAGPVTLVGFDDNPLNDWVAPWLNSVRVPYHQFGAAVARQLRALEQELVPEPVLLGHALIVRKGETVEDTADAPGSRP